MTIHVKNILYNIIYGLKDSFSGIIQIVDLFISTKFSTKWEADPSKHTENEKDSVEYKRKSQVVQKILQCCALNGGICVLSVLIFENVLLPLLKQLLLLCFSRSSHLPQILWEWLAFVLNAIFRALWVLPFFILSRVLNIFWFQDIADSVFQHKRGKPKSHFSFCKSTADVLFSVIIQALFLIQAWLVTLLPVAPVSTILGILHLSLLYSLYAFEYRWFNMGWKLHERLFFIEHYWPYFLGFGLPLALLTSYFSSYIISGCIFATLFPILIISGNDAIHPTCSCGFELRLFFPVVVMSNILLNRSVYPRKKREMLSKSMVDLPVLVILLSTAGCMNVLFCICALMR